MSVTISTVTGPSGVYDFDLSAVNSAGVILGNPGPYILQNGTVTWLGMSFGGGLNDQGEVVGLVSIYATNTSKALSWQGGSFQTLPTLGGTVTAYTEQANAINNNGVIVGNSAAPGGLIEACYWRNGAVVSLGVLPGGAVLLGGYTNSSATAVNDAGQIAGWSYTSAGVNHAVLWQNGAIIDLGAFLPTDSSFARAINSQGQIVGYDEPTSGESHAFSWKNGVMTDLGVLPGRDYSTAEAINSSGIIVGESGPYGDPASNQAVMWVNGKIVDLNSLLAPSSGWFLGTAVGINDNGEIVGNGTYNGAAASYALMLNGTTAAAVGVTVQTALQKGVTTPVAILDSSANVMASLDALEALQEAGHVGTIDLTDSSPPLLAISASQIENDAWVLGTLEGNFNVSLPASLTASQAALASGLASHLASPVSVTDTPANVGAAADGLETLAKAGKLGVITLTSESDGNSLVQLSASGAIDDGDALARIQGTYQEEIGDAPGVISRFLDQLQPLAKSGTLKNIHFTYDVSDPIELTSAQLAADAAVINDISSATVLNITPSDDNGAITGIAGIGNVLLLSGSASRYTIASMGDGEGFSITGAGVTHKISDITAVKFSDSTVFVASQAVAADGEVSSAQVVNLYAAVLARAPDAAGLGYYEMQAVSNPDVTAVSLAEHFLQSPEYRNNTAHNYAQTSAGDTQFINDTYANLLHRTPEAGAVAWYQANVIAPQLAGTSAGTSAYTYAELAAHAAVLADFSQSAEFLGDVSVTAQHLADAQHWLVLI